MAPSRTRPRRGREPGASPQRGEAGRGAARCARWSAQPSMRLRRTQTGMNIGSFWKGVARPHPPAGGGWDNPVPPSPCVRARPAYTRPPGGGVGQPGSPIPRVRARPAPTRPPGGGWDNPVAPSPAHPRPRAGAGTTRLPHPPACGPGPPTPSCGRRRGTNPVAPHPCARARPAPTLPPGGGVGQPGSPMFTSGASPGVHAGGRRRPRGGMAGFRPAQARPIAAGVWWVMHSLRCRGQEDRARRDGGG